MSVERQIEIEKKSVSLGRERYMKELDYKKQHGIEDMTQPALQLIRRTVDTVAEAIDRDRLAVRTGKNRGHLALIEEVEAPVLAHHVLRMMLSTFSRTFTFTQVAVRVGRAVQEELNFRRFEELDPKAHRMTQMHLKTRHQSKHRGIVQHMFKLSEIDPVEWENVEMIRVGAYLLEIAVGVTGWMTYGYVKKGQQRTRTLTPAGEFLAWMEEAHKGLASLSPVRLPMVVEPEPWTSPFDGGYLTELGGQITMVKSWNREYLEALEQVDMDEVYTAINAIQATGWKINRRVLEVARLMWEEGVAVGAEGQESLPARRPLELPAFPAKWANDVPGFKREDFAGWKAWAAKAANIHERNSSTASKRLSAATKLALAEDFVEDTIYFPHQMDFRGRVYPVPAHLNPQGDDLAKALLMFAEGKPLGEEGVAWLMVHVANCFGVDKVSFEERVAWTEAHLEALLESAMDPIDGDRFWTTADDPFLALAGCYELLGWSVEGEDFVSHIPVSMDGSCNGLQNFSALLKDAVGGKATNLVPQEKPADIYAEVARIVAEKVRLDAEAGKEEALRLDGLVDRSLVKQPVMTQPYGATVSGMRSQIEAAIKKKGNPTSIPTSKMWATCGYLATTTYDAIGEVVIAARSAMDWLQETAKVSASEDYPLRWSTPVGFVVLQEYRQPEGQVIRVHIDGKKSKLHVQRQGTKLDRRRQRSGISPNLIHSFDAAHMMKTVLLAQANGISSFALIHDSYGTHAADTPLLHECIRKAFVWMYEGDLLSKFKDEIKGQLPEDVELPEVPPMGTLDLAVIEDSKYFFA